MEAGFDDSEIRAALLRIRRERDEKERTERRAEGRGQVVRLMEERSFEAVQVILRKLVKEFPQDQQFKDDLVRAQTLQQEAEQEAQRRQREEIYNRTKTTAQDFARQGQFPEAIRVYKVLSKQFPDDPSLKQEIANLEEQQKAEERRKATAAQRQKALSAVRASDFELARNLLRPLLREDSKDPELTEAWRIVSVEKRNADWLNVYEKINEIEELYKKGKAAKVKQKALRLLEEAEDPKVRGYLQWAEGELARNPASNSPELDQVKDKLRKWRPF